MNSFDILSKTSPLPFRLFLEASAGTGKTFTIEHLFVRLLLETELALEEIVVVTFTKAAARELKERIRLNLERLQTFPYLQGISETQKWKLQDAAKRFESAQIFTIHGFCLHLLKYLTPGIADPFWSKEEESWEIKQFLLEQTAISPGQMRRLLGRFQYDTQLLTKAILTSSENATLIPSAEELLSEIHRENLSFAGVLREFEKVRPSYKGMNSEDFLPQARDLDAEGLTFKVWDSWIASSKLFLENIAPENLKVRAVPPHSEMLLQLRKTILPRLKIAQNKRSIFLKLAHAWNSHRNQIGKQTGKIGTDDLLQIIHDNLKSSDFAHAVSSLYQGVIVDEFQDTDPLQWKILKTLFLDEQKRAYIVGDPKQSIYGFRKADIYTFLDAKKMFKESERGSLLHNFRSSSSLMADMNRLFCAKPWMDLPKEKTFQTIPELTAAYPTTHLSEGRISWMIAQGEKGRAAQFPTLDLEEKCFFPFIAQEIEQKHPQLNQVAVLVKDRYQASRMKQFFNQLQIPSSLVRFSPLSASPVLELLHELADCFLQDFSTSSLKKLSTTPFIGIPLSQLTPSAVLHIKNCLSNLKNIWMEKGFITFFAQFLHTQFWEKSALLTFCESEESSSYDELMQIIQKLETIHHPDHLKERLYHLQSYETDDQVLTNPEGVQILTIHASKGLEFETVFALGVASRTAPQDLPEEELQELDAEKMRQLYVALTRAKKWLYIPIAQQTPEPNYEIGEGSPIEIFLAKTSPDLSSFSQTLLHEQTFQLHPASPKPKTNFFSSLPLTKSSAAPLFLQSFSSLAKQMSKTSNLFEQTSAVDPLKEEITPGVQTGIVIHRILERYFRQEGPLESVVAEETGRTPLSSQKETLLQMLQSTLQLPLETIHPSFCINDILQTTFQTEMEFLYTTSQGWMKGYIDLCFEYDNRLYAIDWKTNLLESTEKEALYRLMQNHHYLLQEKIYTEALQKHLQRFPSITFGGVFFVFIRGPAIYIGADICSLSS